MSINFPTSIDSFTNPTPTSKRNNPSLAGEMSDKNDAVIALETKVGITSSADTGSLDYIIRHVPVANISATGTPSSTTFLRGDGSWNTPGISGFGDGSDGVVTIIGTVTLSRDMYYSTLTIAGTLVTNGYAIFVSGTLSGAGTIKYPDSTVGVAGSGSTGGAGGAITAATGKFKNIAGGAGANGGPNAGTVGGSTTASPGVVGVAGGAGGNSNGSNGGAGGAAGAVSIYTKFGIFAHLTELGVDLTATPTYVYLTGSAASGGGGGGGQNGISQNGGGGGGGGASGGLILIMASTWAGSFTIQASGAVGGAGGTGANTSTGGGGGGGGGSGGVAIIIYGTKTWTGSYSLAGGAGGAGGPPNNSGGGTGLVGTTGPTGTTGASYEYLITSLVR